MNPSLAYSAPRKTRSAGIGLCMVCFAMTAHAAPDASPASAPYGSWKSAVTAEMVAGARVSIGDLRAVGGRLYWTESVPEEGGSIALYNSADGAAASRVTAAGTNVRTRVHEYGGAPYVIAGTNVFFSEFRDQRLYAIAPGGALSPKTPAGYRYADCQPKLESPVTELFCVREDHTDPKHVRNAVVRLPLSGDGAGEILFGDSDFVAYPRLSPDGKRLAFIAWNHPNMPWDGTELKVAELSQGALRNLTTLAGGASESVMEPKWDADGTLYFMSDRSGFWNLYAHRGSRIVAVSPRAAEFARPLWTLGQSNYALLGNGRAVVHYGEQGTDRLALLDLNKGSLQALDLPYVEYDQFETIDAQHVALVADSAVAPSAILRIDVTSGRADIVRSAGRALLAPDAVSLASPIDFPSTHGRTAHAFYYAPTNPAFSAPPGALPPLLTIVHGGPTAQASPGYAASVQFWTSRGFAVVDVDHGGSSGYGRAFRQELNGNWGVVDVEDVIAAAKYLIRIGRVDPKRVAIRGASAGGYTVLGALTASDVFRAGADYFGISDMTALAHDTHKFESRYLDSLIGPLPEAQSVYDSRSPLNHLDGFKVPLIVLQGADDPVVPPSQSEKIVEALRARHEPVAYLLFPGEQHGFRKPENTIRSLQAELSFYGQVFGFTPADQLPPLKIENLAAAR